jgi:hypothetical protein
MFREIFVGLLMNHRKKQCERRFYSQFQLSPAINVPSPFTCKRPKQTANMKVWHCIFVWMEKMTVSQAVEDILVGKIIFGHN